MADEELTEAEGRMQERQGGGYEPPIVIEPDGGPIPPYRPVVTDGPDEHPDFPTRKA